MQAETGIGEGKGVPVKVGRGGSGKKRAFNAFRTNICKSHQSGEADGNCAVRGWHGILEIGLR